MRSTFWASLILVGLFCERFWTAEGNAKRLRGQPHRRALFGKAKCESQVGIPRVLHHIFLDGEAAYWRNATVGDDFTPNFYPKTKRQGDKNATFKYEWKTGCQRMMPDWTYLFWDMDAAIKLIQEQYSWFLPTFERYSSIVAKGDALRPIILHAYGGLYLDLDVECYRPVDNFLAGHDLVLQAEEHDSKALINAIMASTPHHSFWLGVLKLMKERSRASQNVLFATGPQAVSDAYQAFMKMADSTSREGNSVRGMPGLTPRVYQLGEFYLPCNWLSQHICTQVDNMETKPEHLAGFHHWAGSWKVGG